MASYVYGNVVRKETQPVSPSPAKQKKETSQRVQSNRNRALHMSKGYVIFLAVAAVVVMFACVKYLQLQSEVTTRSEKITSLQQQLAKEREANTTRYNAIVNSMNLEEIREKAMNELGMVYAQPGQVIEYKSPTSNLVTQYANIPESGIIASSEQVE